MTRAELIQRKTVLLKKIPSLKERIAKLEIDFFRTTNDNDYFMTMQSVKKELEEIQKEIDFIKEEMHYDNVLREKGLN